MFLIPAGNITTVERVQRIYEIQELIQSGSTDQEIADSIGMSIAAVKRNIKYIGDLSLSDLTPEDVGEKRGELYLELLEATAQAKKLFEEYRDAKKRKPLIIRSFFNAWVNSINLRAKLYGLDNIKVDSFTQIYAPTTKVEADYIDSETGVKIANMIKKSHETKVQKKDI